MTTETPEAARNFIELLEKNVTANLAEIETHKECVNELRKTNRRKRTLIQNVAKEHGIHTGE